MNGETHLLPLLCPFVSILKSSSAALTLSLVISLSFDHTQWKIELFAYLLQLACVLIEIRTLVLLFVHLLRQTPLQAHIYSHLKR